MFWIGLLIGIVLTIAPIFELSRYLGRRKGIRVAVAGGFDPLHIGHIRHLEAAKKLGNWLIVIVNSDEDMIRKKGFYFMPLEQRMEIIRSLRFVDEVVACVDKDGTCTETLLKIKPKIFAKGGDRTPENIPKREIEACEEIGCEIVYGMGGDKIESSSELVKKSQSLLK